MKKWAWDDTDRVVFVIGALIGVGFLSALCVFLIKASRVDAQIWAAWAQAVGSLTAVGFAAWVYWRQADEKKSAQNKELMELADIFRAMAMQVHTDSETLLGCFVRSSNIGTYDELSEVATQIAKKTGHYLDLTDKIPWFQYPKLLIYPQALRAINDIRFFRDFLEKTPGAPGEINSAVKKKAHLFQSMDGLIEKVETLTGQKSMWHEETKNISRQHRSIPYRRKKTQA